MNKTAKKSWRPGMMTWLIIGGLVLVNVSVFFSSNDPQALQRFLHYLNPYHFPDWYSTNLWLVFAGLLVALVLKSNRVQKALHSFYSLHFWKTVKTRIKKSKPNQAAVRLLLHKKTGKWLLRKWLLFWKNIRIERYPFYAWVFTFLAIFIVFFKYSELMEIPRDNLWYLWKSHYFLFDYYMYEPFYLGPLVKFNQSGTITWRLFIAPATGLLLIIWLLRLASKSKKRKTP